MTTDNSDDMIDDLHIDLTDHPPQEARDVLLAGLIDFNRRLLGDPQGKPLVLLLTSADGTVVGGMWARTGFKWLFVELLFVPESLRGRGLGRELLDRAEQEARRRGCIGALARDIESAGPYALRKMRLHRVRRNPRLSAGQRAHLPLQAMGSMIGMALLILSSGWERGSPEPLFLRLSHPHERLWRARSQQAAQS